MTKPHRKTQRSQIFCAGVEPPERDIFFLQPKAEGRGQLWFESWLFNSVSNLFGSFNAELSTFD